jgi:hypothetical protein
MMALTFHPVVACRSCVACRAYQHGDNIPVGETQWTFGAVQKDAQGNPRPRPRGSKPPCEMNKKACPKGHWSRPIELSETNWQALTYHDECEAVGAWPDDAIVRRNAAIIVSVRKSFQRTKQEELSALLRIATTRR